MKIIAIFSGIVFCLLLLGCTAEQPEAAQDTPLQEEQQSTERPTEAPQEPALSVTQLNESLLEPEEQPAENSTSQQPTLPSSSRCKDSDVTAEHPDGINFDVVGNVTINGKPLERGTDYCANLVTISEWYCQDGIARVKTTKCQTGSCKEGVCV